MYLSIDKNERHKRAQIKRHESILCNNFKVN